MTHIMTFSGGQCVDVENIQPGEIPIEELALSLARVPRWAGHTKKGVVYSVAEHSVWVSQHVPWQLALPALLHDVEEALFGDIPTPIKHLSHDIVAAGDKVRNAIWLGLGCHATDLEWEYIRRSDYLALQVEARDLMHPNIQRFIALPSSTVPPVEPIMNEQAIVDLFLRHFHDASTYVQSKLAEAERAKLARLA